MTTARSSGMTLLDTALELAVRAPSLHNIQPWRWRSGDDAVELFLDTSRRLPATDPHDRELTISCGAALHHLVVALAGMGRAATVHRLPDPARPSCLARVELTERPPSPSDVALAAAIPRRRTDRRRFTCWPVPPELLGELHALARIDGLTLNTITTPDLRWTLHHAITDAARLQSGDQAVTAELAAWSGRDTTRHDGVPAANVPSLTRVPGQPPMRAFARPELTAPATSGEPENAALLVVSTPVDRPLQWLRTGELTSAILLTATRDGLGSSPLTQPFEVADTRAVLRSALGGRAHPQILIRLGWPTPATAQLPITPRRPVADVAGAMNDWRGI
jgi:hypothetical protein